MAAAANPTGQVVDPYINFNFMVELDGIVQATFHECSGYDSNIDVIEHREGGATTPRKLPGLTKHSNLVLKRGLTSSVELWNWHAQTKNGNVQRKSGSIVICDRSGAEVLRWHFYNAWPCKWTGPQLTSEGNDVAIEALELAYETLELAT